MSVYTRIQFCMPEGESPKIELRKHPDLPVLMLSLSYQEGEFTIDGTPDALRGWLTSILSHPLLANVVTNEAESRCVYYEGATGFAPGVALP